VDLDQPCLQADFAALVGISQPAVSELLTRGVLKPKQSARAWLLAYTHQLREQAAGRGADGELAINRAAESKTRNDLLQIKLKRARGDYAEVALIEQVLAHIGSQIASQFEPLPARIKMLCPGLTPDDLQGIEAVITEARNLAARASIAVLAEVDPDAEADDEMLEDAD
jgi:phage terminase Nu1 subunit (DNA packaging protein)